MRRLVLAVLALGLALLPAAVLPGRAYACSCVGLSTQRAAEQAEAVFTGTVRSLDPTRSGREQRVDIRFEVSRVYKGQVYATQVVATGADSAGCGLTPEPGSTWTIFATRQVIGSGDAAITRLRTGLCDGNLPQGTAPGFLGRGEAPQPGESDRAERSVHADERVTRFLVGGGLGLLGLVVLAGIGTAVLWRTGRRT